MSTYYTIERPSVAEYKDRGSRFVAYAYPIKTAEDFKKQLKLLKEEHPKAAHHCFAYRIGIEGTNPQVLPVNPYLGKLIVKNSLMLP
jgi:putative IMPACT (imprinted ancient) family translation regulator